MPLTLTRLLLGQQRRRDFGLFLFWHCLRWCMPCAGNLGVGGVWTPFLLLSADGVLRSYACTYSASSILMPAVRSQPLLAASEVFYFLFMCGHGNFLSVTALTIDAAAQRHRQCQCSRPARYRDELLCTTHRPPQERRMSSVLLPATP